MDVQTLIPIDTFMIDIGHRANIIKRKDILPHQEKYIFEKSVGSGIYVYSF